METLQIEGREVLASDHISRVAIVRQSPSTKYCIFVEGLCIPHVTVVRDMESNEMLVMVDNRLAWLVTEESLFQMAPVLANAMAVAAGFSSFGPNSQLLNPYKKHGNPGE